MNKKSTDATNLARARRILDAMTGRWGKPATTRDAARALADAGLLAPDLPAANDTELPLPTKTWVLDAEGRPVVWTAPGGRVMIQRVEPGDLTPDQARTFALNVIAAAAYSEGEPR